MFNFIEKVMKTGYTDEHKHRLYGSAAIAHLTNLPVKNLNRQKIEKGRVFIQNHIQ